MTTTLTPTATGAHLAAAMEPGFQLVLGMVDGFDEKTCAEAPKPHMPLVWFLGHLTCAKDYFNTLHQGMPKAVTEEFSDNFADGASTNFAIIPPLGEMVDLYVETHTKIRDFVSQLEPEDLTRRCVIEPDANLAEYAAPFMVLGDALALTQLHDSFHAGQMAQMRRSLGMTSPV